MDIKIYCNGLNVCEFVNGSYVCDVSDSNYFFTGCDSLLLTTEEEFNPSDIDKIVKNLKFIYEQDGKEIHESIIPNFVFREREENINSTVKSPCYDYRFKCDIKRPSSLIINGYNPEKSIKNLHIAFKSDIMLSSVQWGVITSNVGNYRRTGLWTWFKNTILK
jgi:hypothetical protein